MTILGEVGGRTALWRSCGTPCTAPIDGTDMRRGKQEGQSQALLFSAGVARLLVEAVCVHWEESGAALVAQLSLRPIHDTVEPCCVQHTYPGVSDQWADQTGRLYKARTGDEAWQECVWHRVCERVNSPAEVAVETGGVAGGECVMYQTGE